MQRPKPQARVNFAQQFMFRMVSAVMTAKTKISEKIAAAEEQNKNRESRRRKFRNMWFGRPNKGTPGFGSNALRGYRGRFTHVMTGWDNKLSANQRKSSRKADVKRVKHLNKTFTQQRQIMCAHRNAVKGMARHV